MALIVLFPSFMGGQARAQYKTDYIVAKDGSGDFTTIQSAIDASKSFPYERITIHVKNGVYKEKVNVHSWNPKISIIGESREKTIISYDDYFDEVDRGRNSTFFTYTFLVQGNDFHAANLTIKNDAGPVGQAVALHVEGDRIFFENCRLSGNQDTIYLAGEGSRQYFKDCYIEGTTDFIFGQATAVFQGCIIRSKANSYITAASTPEEIRYGFIFKNCKLTAASDINKVFLGRPWRKYAKTVILNCWLGGHIRPEGWDNWNDTTRKKSVFYAEYQNRGPGYTPDKRVEWSHQLSLKEAENYSISRIFGDWSP